MSHEEPGRRAERPACRARTPTPLPQAALSWLQARYSLLSLAVPLGARGSRPASPARLSRDQVLFPLSLCAQKHPSVWPDPVRPLWIHLSSSPRGTENNGQEKECKREGEGSGHKRKLESKRKSRRLIETQEVEGRGI